MSTVLCFGGIGSDSRVFKYLDSTLHKYEFVEWIRPENKESLPSYAKRLAAQITIPEVPILLGVSFGGIVALELSSILKPALTILMSSVKNPAEIPWYFRLAGRTGIHHTAASKLVLRSEAVVDYAFGVTEDDQRCLLHDIISNTNDEFMSWAIDRLLKWQGCTHVGRLFHIHGTSDRLLPARFVDADMYIDGGSHFMIVTSGNEIASAIDDILGS